MKKILILVPAATARGGITNYYQVLKNEFSENIEYLERGARTWPVRKGLLSELYRAWKDYSEFKRRFKKNDINLVQTSTSLGLSTTIRDGLFVRYARKKNVKSVVFFRGWDEYAESIIEKKFLWLFRYFFFLSNAVITLSNRSKEKLTSWGYKNEIYLETTLVNKQIFSVINEDYIKARNTKLLDTKQVNLLFFSRIEKRKGIYELLHAYKEIQNIGLSNFQFHLDIGGDGFELENIKIFIRDEGIHNVTIHGFVSGDKKKELFNEAHIFIFPSYGEGMPNAVLEAMAAGLVIVTTPVGGLVDFFKDGLHGRMIGSPDCGEIISVVDEILSSPEKILSMALNAHLYARDNFYSDIVAARIMKIFNKTIRN